MVKESVEITVPTPRSGKYANLRMMFVGALLLLRWTPGIAQPQFSFDRLTVDDGLSTGPINCIYKDHYGYMWFATADGLDRYDGYTITVFRHDGNDPRTISDNTVYSLVEDHTGRLWIGTNNGVNAFDENTNSFIHPEALHSLREVPVSSFVPGADSSLWIGTFQGLYHYNLKTGELDGIHHDPANRASIASDFITCLYPDGGGCLWIGTNDKGLSKFDPPHHTVLNYSLETGVKTSGRPNSVHAICGAPGGSLWIATWGGLWNFEPRTGRFITERLDTAPGYDTYANTVWCVCPNSDSSLFVGTLSGFNVLNTTTHHILREGNRPTDIHSLSHDEVQSIYKEPNGTIWVGAKSGINVYSRYASKFTLYRHDPVDHNSIGSNFVWSICADENNVVWIGTDGKGLDRYDRNRNTFAHYRHDPAGKGSLSNDDVMAILKDHTGELWVGTWNGINRFISRENKFMHGPSDDVTIWEDKSHIMSICEDADRGILVGTKGAGVWIYDRNMDSLRQGVHSGIDFSSLDHEIIHNIFQDENRDFWIGTTKGLVRIDHRNREFLWYRHDSTLTSLSDNYVTSITKDRHGTLWVGTRDGLNALEAASGHWVHYGVSQGLPNDMILGIMTDNTGNLWLSTYDGIASLNPATGAVRKYDVFDGLQGNEFNEFAYCRGKSGELFFGGPNGVSSFFPDRIADNDNIPPVVLTSFKIFDRPLNPFSIPGPERGLKLGYSENTLSFEFASLDYARPAKNQYAYFLVGFDRDWIYSGTRRYVSYTNLDPGRYTLRVKGSNNDGVWNETGLEIPIVITPPFWRTWWFEGAAVSLLLVLAGLSHRLRIRVIRKQNEFLEDRIESRTRELNVMNSQLSTEILDRRNAEDELRRYKETLEEQVLQRTTELESTVDILQNNVNAREQAEKDLLEHQAKLRALAFDVSTTEERERRRLAMVLHDSIGQALAMCRLKLGSQNTTISEELLNDIRKYIDEATRNTQSLTFDLSPPILYELSFEDAIEWLTEQTGNEHRFPVYFCDDKKPKHLSQNMRVFLYHAIRELLINVVKHAHAHSAKVSLYGDGSVIRITVQDDGKGFEGPVSRPHDAKENGHFGLFNLRERLTHLEGNLEIESRPDEGTTVTLIVPTGDVEISAYGEDR